MIIIMIAVLMAIIFIPIFSFIKPSIFIHNNTSKDVYVYSSESTYGIEPDVEGAEETMETKLDIIRPGETLKLAPSISSLLKENIRRDTGWRIWGRYPVNSTGGEGQAFLLT